MSQLSVLDMLGNQIGEIELNDAIFGIEPNIHVMHEAVTNYLANRRQGTQSVLTRSEVSGGGKKPWRQKGTGHARQGSIRAPQWRHGGVVFAPKPRSYEYRINKKVKKLAIRSAFSAKLADNQIIVLESISLNEYKTKTMINMFNAINAFPKALVVLDENNEMIINSIRNIPKIKTVNVDSINTYNILNAGKLVLLKNAVKKIEEVYA